MSQPPNPPGQQPAGHPDPSWNEQQRGEQPAGYQQQGYSQQGYPQPEYPQQGYQQGYQTAPGGYPQLGYPSGGYRLRTRRGGPLDARRVRETATALCAVLTRHGFTINATLVRDQPAGPVGCVIAEHRHAQR